VSAPLGRRLENVSMAMPPTPLGL